MSGKKADTCRNGHPYTEENTAQAGVYRKCRTCQREKSARFYRRHYSEIRSKEPQGAWKFIKERAEECKKQRERKKKLEAIKRARQKREIERELRRSLTGHAPHWQIKRQIKERVLCGLRAGFWRQV